MATFREHDAGSDPQTFTSNQLTTSYIDEGTTTLTDAPAINGLSDMTSSGNVIGACSGGVGP